MPRTAKQTPAPPPAPRQPLTADEKRRREIEEEAARRAAYRARFAKYQGATREERAAAQHQGRTSE